MKKYFWSLCVLAVAATACSKDDTQEVLPATTGKETIDQLGGILGETRTYLDGTKVMWEKQDQITVWSNKALDKKIFTLSEESIGSQTGIFTATPGEGVMLRGDATYYAVYPTNSEGNIQIPSNQSWRGFANFFKNVNPMIAVGNDLSHMEFQNPCGIIAIELYADDAQTTLDEITLTSMSQILSGVASVEFDGLSYTLNVQSSAKSVRLECGQELGVGKENANTFYIVVPARVYKDLTITAIYSRTGDEAGLRTLARTRKKTPIDVKPGVITKVSANFELITHDPHVYKIGDPYPFDHSAEKPVQGIVFQTEANGLSGKMIALNDCTVGGTEMSDEYGTFYYYTWGPTTTSANLSSTTDGSANMAAVLAVDPSLANYPAFKACRDLGEEWYLPASDEMTALLNAGSALEIALPQYGGSSMLGVGYWCSNITGMGRTKNIYYYDALTGSNTTVATGSQSTKTNSVRAIAQF